MDTSPKYIKMCAKAMKYLPQPQWGWGDLWTEDGVTVLVVTPDHFPVANCVPLYRQDQLQAMVGDMYTCLWMLYWWVEGGLVGRYEGTERGDYRGYKDNSFASMEQLWLAFVMWDRYGKVWNGKGWVTPIRKTTHENRTTNA